MKPQTCTVHSTDQKDIASSTDGEMTRTVCVRGTLSESECCRLNDTELHQHAMGGGKISATMFYFIISTLMDNLNCSVCIKPYIEATTNMMKETVICLIQNGNELSDRIIDAIVSFKSNEPDNYMSIFVKLLISNGYNLNQKLLTYALTCDLISDELMFDAFQKLMQINPDILKEILLKRPSLVHLIAGSKIDKPMFLTVTCNFGRDESVLYLAKNGYAISEKLFETLLDKQRNKTLNYLVLSCLTCRYSKYPKNFPFRSFLMMCVNMLY